MLLAATLVALPWLSVKYAPVVVTLAAIALWRLCRRGDTRVAVGFAVARDGRDVVALYLLYGVYHGLVAGAAKAMGPYLIAGALVLVGIVLLFSLLARFATARMERLQRGQ